jgi:hypothetical protein
MKYRKRPVIVDAEQFTCGIPPLSTIMQASQPTGVSFMDWPIFVDQQGPYLLVHSRTGKQRVNPQDWVVREVDGSFCAVKDDTFNATYERVA